MYMLRVKIDSWGRFTFALLVFWAVLCLTDGFFSDLAPLNERITLIAVEAGYVVALRGICLLLILVATLSMTALVRRGLIIAPLVWAANCLRFTLTGPYQAMMKYLFFVSELLNSLLLIFIPIVLVILLWWALGNLDPQLRIGRLVVPGLWGGLVVAVSAGNFFVWHWSHTFGMNLTPPQYSLLLMLTGLGLTALIARHRPWKALLLYFLGLLVPAGFPMALLGWYEGLGLYLTILLPFAHGGFFSVWLELMLMLTGPILLVLVVSQYRNWKRGDRLIEII
jgi:hypothetical protein